MRNGIDDREIRRYKQNLERLLRGDLEQFCKDTVNEMGARLLRLVKQKTPVETGSLRREWNIEIVQKQGEMYYTIVFNPLEYAPYIEYGHRTKNHHGWVQGYFMMTLSEQEIQTMSQAIITRKIERFVRRSLGI